MTPMMMMLRMQTQTSGGKCPLAVAAGVALALESTDMLDKEVALRILVVVEEKVVVGDGLLAVEAKIAVVIEAEAAVVLVVLEEG